MSPRQRIVLLALAALVLVGGIALAASSGGGDDEPEQQTGAATTPPVQTTTAGEKPKEPPKPEPRMETIRIRDGKPVGGVQTLRFESGETIRLRFRSNAPGEVHIHGFDQEIAVGPSGDEITRFKATLEGIFEIEEHGTGEILAKLEIRPE